jgi:lipoprotein LprG
LILLVAGCRTPELPQLPPKQIIENASARMSAMPGFHFVIDRSGAPAYIDSAETLSFRRAEGDYRAPERARATVRIIMPGLVTDVNVISVAAVQWETNPLTGQWQELPPDWGFNPTVLFDPEIGLQAVLTADLEVQGEVSSEKLDDGPDELLYVIRGQVTGERLFEMSNGLIGPDPVDVTIWVASETFELYRILATEPVPDSDEPSMWQVDFSNFDQALEIEPPSIEQ